MLYSRRFGSTILPRRQYFRSPSNRGKVMTEKKSTSARLVKDDGLRRKLHMPDGSQGVILTQDGTGMVIMEQGRSMGQIVRDQKSRRLKVIMNGQETPVEEDKRDKASA